MGSESQTQVSEELLGILKELSEQDERTILQGMTALRARRPICVDDLLKKGSQWLSRIEKHILAVHRDELAKLLTDECLRLFLSDPEAVVLPNWDAEGNKILPMDVSQFNAKRDEDCARISGDRSFADAHGLLRSLVPGSPGGRARLLEVAEAAYLLRPSDALSIYVARGEEFAGNREAAKSRLAEVYRHPCKYYNKLVAAAMIGVLHMQEGQEVLALEWYKRSATGGEPCVNGAMLWAAHAIRRGAKKESEDALLLLTNDYEPDDPAFAESLHLFRAAVFTGRWQIEPQAQGMVASLPQSPHDHVQGIKNVFL